MQPVNNDMDNLFRQAAENYPLNTQGADFDKLLQRIDAAGDAAPPEKGSRRRYGWLLLLLLLPLPFLCRHYYTAEVKDMLPVAEQQFTKNTGQPTTIAAPNNNTTDNQNIPAASTLANTSNNAAPSDAIQSGTSGSSTAPQQQGTKEVGLPLQKSSEQPADKTTTAIVQHTRKLPGTNNRLYSRTKHKQNKYYLKWAISDTEAGNKSGKRKTEDQSSNEKEIASGIAQPATECSRQPDSLVQTDSTKHLTNKQNDTTNTVTIRKDIIKDSTVTDSGSIAKNQKIINKKVKPFFYAGAVAGIDYSVVKSKQTAGTGYSTGLVAGYRFGRHWAVETGLLWAYKKYRSEGKYIDTTGLGLAGHTQVLNANGSCGMLEIPLTVQYHFSNKNRGHWYTVAGLSSYLMKKEEYYYVGKRYNMVYYAEREYTNSTKNWFSVLQLGGGYQLQLGKHSSLRAEPYVKLPLSKIGIAKLPLSSAGINIGYTRPL